MDDDLREAIIEFRNSLPKDAKQMSDEEVADMITKQRRIKEEWRPKEAE